MKILIIHNNYTHRGGEEGVVEFQQRLFKQHGHEVFMYNQSNDVQMSLPAKLNLFLHGFYNRRTKKEVEILIQKHHFDVCIVHNLYHKITPSVLVALRQAGIPTVMVLHNYRLLCPIGLLFRDGAICHRCVEGNCLRELNCFVHNCDGARFTSLFIALRSWWVRESQIISKNIDKLVCLTPFQQHLLAQHGLTNSVVIPNAVSLDGEQMPLETQKGYFAFAGRLGYEKGFDLFLELARQLPNEQFKVAGNPETMMPGVEIPKNVEMCGFLSGKALRCFYHEAKALFVGSRWYEGFPLICLEAFAARTAIIVPTGKSFQGMIVDGVNGYEYNQDNLTALVERIRQTDLQQWIAFGENGREKVTLEYSPDVYYQKYMELFETLRAF